METRPIIEPELLKELHGFETFLKRVGFKRIEGAVYGLLVLSYRPLTSEEIESTLHLSQGTVSMALKKLSHFGAIETRESRERRTKLHSTKEDSLAIVATVFRKREQEAIEEFKAMAKRILRKTEQVGGPRGKRLKSLIDTCEIAEAVMNFVINLTSKSETPGYEEIVKRLPKILETISYGTEPLSQIASGLTNVFTSKLKEKLIKIAPETLPGKWPAQEDQKRDTEALWKPSRNNDTTPREHA